MSRRPVQAPFLSLVTLPFVLAHAAPVTALEKTSARITDDHPEQWNASTSGTIRYYNNCTGWVWVWSGWSPGERLGVCFDTGAPVNTLVTTWALTFSGVPSGYGFTGTISAMDGCDCSASPLATQPYVPPVTSGWSATAWGGVVVPSPFLISVTWSASTGFTNGTGLASDHPFAGPTGPTACGTCFPSNRTVHSRYYGVGGANCPSGVTLSDGLCDIEFMIDAEVRIPFGLQGESWGRVKTLYR
jgi:hypothetical protein